jgi:hypothetical protein
MLPEATAALRRAVETVRAQIPKGELTLASVERLLKAAEAVCAEPEPVVSSTSTIKPSPQVTKRQEERRKWARIAKQNEKDALSSSNTSE